MGGPEVAAVSMFLTMAGKVYEADQMKKMANLSVDVKAQEAQLRALEVDETVRRKSKDAMQQESLALALAAASGVDVDSLSNSIFIDDLKKANDEELAWLRTAGDLEAKKIRAEGEMLDAEYSGKSNIAFFSAAGAGLKGFAQASDLNWFETSPTP